MPLKKLRLVNFSRNNRTFKKPLILFPSFLYSFFWYNMIKKRLTLFSLKHFNHRKEDIQIYSPKISEDLIPIIYRKAKKEKIPMTKIVNDLLREKLTEKVSDQKTESTESTETEIKSIAS